jgi:bifunctional DNA-binding transcriptional regulator/antitoxin component of YhaV-PrlF toxin-antitoxin module
MRTTLTVDNDGILTFSPEILEATGWKEGDVLEWIDNNDGSFSLIKSDDDEIYK